MEAFLAPLQVAFWDVFLDVILNVLLDVILGLILEALFGTLVRDSSHLLRIIWNDVGILVREI